MKFYVGVTDKAWFEYLRQQQPDEVNFWRPGGGRHFRALSQGDPFLFKLHAPDNFIVGGGFFDRESIVPIELAWEAFGQKNGVASFDEFYRRILGYKRQHVSGQPVNIGCIILLQPFFFSREEWIPTPADFHPNIVQGKTYDTADAVGARLWAQVQERLSALTPPQVAETSHGDMYGDPSLVRRRLGQGAFRVAVTDAYERRCAVTGERALPALEAAHILPVRKGGTHRIDNGVLLRSDVHRLFDQGYVTITPDYEFEVSPRLKTDWDNGEPYYPFSGRQVALPQRETERPSPEFLEWHRDEVYRP